MLDLNELKHHFLILGLKEEGIFRIPGAQEEVDNLKKSFNTGSFIGNKLNVRMSAILINM